MRLKDKEKQEELRRWLNNLKQEHFRDLTSDNIDGLMTTEDEFDDLKTNDKYSFNEFIGNKSLWSPQSPQFDQNAPHTRLNYHELLQTKKPVPLNTEKKRPISGLVRHWLSKLEWIYGNLPELVVPLEEEDGNLSPSESTFSVKTGFTKHS